VRSDKRAAAGLEIHSGDNAGKHLGDERRRAVAKVAKQLHWRRQEEEKIAGCWFRVRLDARIF